MASFKKTKVADFFMTEVNPYSKKRSIRFSHVASFIAVLAVVAMGLGTYFDNKAKTEREAAHAAKEVQNSLADQAGAARATGTQDTSYESIHSSWFGMSPKPVGGGRRQLTASQIIKRGESAGDVLPMGTQIHVRLIGQVESMDSSSPVTAILLEDAISPGQALVIPRGSKVIGVGQLDSNRERLQVRFSTLVFPEGEQYGVSGLAMMADGSSGLSGDFSTGLLRRHASHFLGSFVGGLAEGMKDRSTGGQLGIPFEPGSLKNGALNGVAQSSLDYAKSSSEQMGQVTASIKVENGKEFILYLEREFHQ